MSRAFADVENSLTGKRWAPLAEKIHRHGLAISQSYDIPEIVSRLIAMQNVSVEDVQTFMDAKIKALMPNPKSFKDLEKAASRILQAINKKQKIAIFSDYDVDGAASGAILNNWLREFGISCTIYIPDRITEGFGPSVKAMKSLSRNHDLIICLDCGTVAFEGIKAAQPKDVIIIDHHLAEEFLPAAYAVVNPSRQDETGDFKYLCATGMVFILLVEANSQLRRNSTTTPDLLKFLDLVALAIVADVAPMTDLNRAFVKQGLTVMAKRKNPGLSALCDICKLNSPPSTEDLGFLLAPRINAGGRIGDSKLGIKLLVAETDFEAEAIAARLDELNNDRRKIEARALNEAEDQILRTNRDGSFIWVAKEEWHPGVVGIIASRLKEKYNKPAIVISINNGLCSGSARSVKGVNIGFAISKLANENLIIKGGGHSMAAGLSLNENQILKAMERLEKILLKNITEKNHKPELTIAGAIRCRAASEDLVAQIETAGPFGNNVPPPNLALLNQKIIFTKRIGENHLRLSVSDEANSKLEVIAFKAFDSKIGKTLEDHNGMKFHLVGQIKIDNWGGKRRVKLHLLDAALA